MHMIIRRGAFNNKAPKITRRAVDMGMRYGLSDPRVIAQSHVVDRLHTVKVPMNKIVLGLSGGMDSATLLGSFLHENLEVHCCSFEYGSTHGLYETKAMNAILAHYEKKFPNKIKHHPIDIKNIMSGFSSSLLINNEKEIPEGFYNDDNMKKTVVPGRNLIFASILAGIAESVGATKISLGIHSGDHHIYPDCRPEFVKALDSVIYLSTDKKVEVISPFLYLDKASILKIGYSLKEPVPYHLTRTCYKNQEDSCGKCGSCLERLEAFKIIGKKDPIKYEVD